VLAGVYETSAAGRRLSLAQESADGLAVPSSPTCVLEGRIYNARELGQQLKVDGAGVDAEAVLLAAWRRWGEAMLGRLRGDFALLVWDPSSQTGLLARDQLGSGSVYFHSRGGRLVFGSEVSRVLALLPTRPAPDEAALAHWLSVSGPPEGRTLYAGVRRLGEGCLIRLGEGRWEEGRYWSPRYEPTTESDREAAIAGIRERLRTAVERRMSVGRVGVMLSGGLDSSAVAGVAAELSGGQASGPPAYSAVFPLDPRADESELIESLVTSLGLDSVRIAVAGGSPLAGMLEYLQEFELPPSSANLFFWLPLLRRAAADGVTALMDGEGGDEALGTAHYLLADRVRSGRLLDALRLTRSFPGAGDKPPWRTVLSVLRDYGFRGAFLAGSPRDFHPAPPWLTPPMQAAYRDSEDPWAWARAPGPRWWAYLVRAVTSAKGSVLARDQVRHRSALAGIEAQHPLLDLDLVEYVFSLDPALAFDRYRSRPLLRGAVQGLIPDTVRLRRWKSSFDAVFHRGLLETDRATLERLLGDSRAEIRAYVNPATLRDELLSGPGSGFASGKQAWALYAWRLATAECWLQAQRDPEAPRRALDNSQPARVAIRTQAAARRQPASAPLEQL
jgi:asparagine synthase (glutamine-hydrolysing)